MTKPPKLSQIKVLDQLTDILARFHDGEIEYFAIQENEMELSVNLYWIAELHKPSHQCFRLTLKGINGLFFEPWTHNKEWLSDWDEILKLEHVFLSTKLDSTGIIIIETQCRNVPNELYQGGKLFLECEGYDLKDEDGFDISVERLTELVSFYWKEVFGKGKA